MKKVLTFGAALGLALITVMILPSSKSFAGSLSIEQRKEFGAVIRDYLIKNPVVIREAMEALRAQDEVAKQARAAAALDDYKEELFWDKTSPVGGNPKGDVTVVEFFDYICGYCKRVASTLKAVMKKDPNLRVVYKEFAILGPESIAAAKAALAARKQSKYLEFHNGLMAGQTDEDSIAALANSLGMDYSQLRKDMTDPQITETLKKNYQLANALGIKGTPAFVVGKRLVSGAIDEVMMTQIIKEERAKVYK